LLSLRMKMFDMPGHVFLISLMAVLKASVLVSVSMLGFLGGFAFGDV
jgi:hypothetical protein